MPWKKRTHTCGELRAAHEGQEVVLNGWVGAIRDHGKVLFADLRDRFGSTQLVFQENRAECIALARSLRPEFVLAAAGRVRKRSPETVNKNLPTGEIEIDVQEAEILNEAKPVPFPIDDSAPDPEIRLKFRYLDLRRPEMQKTLLLRTRVTQLCGSYFEERGFVEVETPTLIKYTPGGARNFLVPSRLYPGQFYALAESPQIFKQLCMVGGLDRYFQIARCFRDEDLRADRQQEFTQLDIEMSFVDREDVMREVEGCIRRVFLETMGILLPSPFPVMTYRDAMLHYGTDKPDLRYGMEIEDVTDSLRETEFQILRNSIRVGCVVRGFAVPGGSEMSRKDVDSLADFVRRKGGKGLLSAKVEAGGLAGGFAAHLTPKERLEVAAAVKARPGDLVVLISDSPEQAALLAGALRREVAELRGLVRKNDFRFLWVVEFPMFEAGATPGSIVARHHPFTCPMDEDLGFLEERPLDVRAKAYDLVVNGIELGGGSIRIHRRDIQQRIFKLIGLSGEQAREKFGFLLDAFEYGAPPHGGIALGMDRMVAILRGLESIRDVIAFPKTQSAQDLMMGAPAPVTDEQLKDVHIQIRR